MRIRTLGLSELLLKEHFRLSLVRLMLHGLICLIVKSLLRESRLLRKESRPCIILCLPSDIYKGLVMRRLWQAIMEATCGVMYHWIVQVVLKLKRLYHTLAITEHRARACSSEVWQL